MSRHDCAVVVVLYEIAAAGGERRFAAFYPQLQIRERVLGTGTRFPGLSCSHIFSSFQQYVIASLKGA